MRWVELAWKKRVHESTVYWPRCPILIWAPILIFLLVSTSKKISEWFATFWVCHAHNRIAPSRSEAALGGRGSEYPISHRIFLIFPLSPVCLLPFIPEFHKKYPVYASFWAELFLVPLIFSGNIPYPYTLIGHQVNWAWDSTDFDTIGKLFCLNQRKEKRPLNWLLCVEMILAAKR